MVKLDAVISGIGVVSPCGIGKSSFIQSIVGGIFAPNNTISNFKVPDDIIQTAFEIKDLDLISYLGLESAPKIGRAGVILLAAAKMALEDAKLTVTNANTDRIGICTATLLSDIGTWTQFDRENANAGFIISNPAIFPLTFIQAPSLQISTKFNIQGFNTTVSSGYTGGLEALKYALTAIEEGRVESVLVAGIDLLSLAFLKDFYKSRPSGPIISCPYDNERNGAVLGEGAAVIIVENALTAKVRGAKILASVKSAATYFQNAKTSSASPGFALERSILKALDDSDTPPFTVDYISGCADSSFFLDKMESDTIKRIFQNEAFEKPLSSIKSVIGETFSPASLFQIVSCVAAMEQNLLPPTINYKNIAKDLDLDYVPNKARKKEVNTALITSVGPDGSAGAAVLKKYSKY